MADLDLMGPVRASQDELDAQAGDLDALLNRHSVRAPSLEVLEDTPYGSGAVAGALSAAANDPVFQECAFGETTRDLRDAPHLMVSTAQHLTSAAALPSLVATQLRMGLRADGWDATEDIESLYDQNVDEYGIYVNTVDFLTTGERFDWLEFFMGDTEVGYLFRAGTTELVGCVGDGEIYGCTIRLPQAKTAP